MTITRRFFGSVPSNEVLAQIEAMNIADLGTPSRVDGIPSGLVAIVGEFPDVTYGVSVSSVGIVTSSYRPTLITSPTEIVAKLGGADPTIGDHGVSGGNGWVTLRNKSWPGGFVAVPINIAGGKAVRLWRELPTNTSLTNPTPITNQTAGTVLAGREFSSGGVRVRCAKTVTFTGTLFLARGTDAAMASASAAATMDVVVAGDVTAHAILGNALVLGVLGGAAANQGTYRILSSSYAASNTTIVVENLDGTNITAVLASAQPWRIHNGTDMDTGVTALASQGGYKVPARPLTNNAGSLSVAGTITQATLLPPATAESAGSGTAWSPLSGLKMKIMPTESAVAGGLAFDPNIHAINAVAHATIDAEYVAAMAALLGDASPQRMVTIGPVVSRTSNTIRAAMREHTLKASTYGFGRMAPMSPPLSTLTRDAATGSNPGVDSYRDETIVYNWFGLQTYVPEFVATPIKGADGNYYTDGFVDTPSDAWVASIMANLPPEENPAQETQAVKNILVFSNGYQRGAPVLTVDDYIALKAEGVMAPNYNDDLACVVFQSGVTTDLRNGHTDINRRRFSFFIDDTLARALKKYVKVLDKPVNKEGAIDEVTRFLEGLLAPDTPPRSRIKGYKIDLSLNTADTEEKGFFFIGWNVRTYVSIKAMVGVAQIGETVEIRSGN